MRRREFIAALGGAAVWPPAMRIGVIGIIALMTLLVGRGAPCIVCASSSLPRTDEAAN